MATVLKFDEINKPTRKAIPYREFFGKMRISVEQMNLRIEIAEAFEDAMLYVFAYWLFREDLDLSDDDMKNPYWPNCCRNGSGAAGLGECTRQINRGTLYNYRTVKIADALKNLRIRFGKGSVSMYIPGVSSEYPYDADDNRVTIERLRTYTKHAGIGPLMLAIEVELYLDTKPAPKPQFILDNFNSDFTHYQGILVAPFMQRGKRYALVSLYKLWFDWNDKSSYGAPMCHEFVTDLVKTGNYYRLGLSPGLLLTE